MDEVTPNSAAVLLHVHLLPASLFLPVSPVPRSFSGSAPVLIAGVTQINVQLPVSLPAGTVLNAGTGRGWTWPEPRVRQCSSSVQP